MRQRALRAYRRRAVGAGRPRYRDGRQGMSDELIGAAERLLHARPADADEALAALEWVAGREGKTVAQLIAEIGDRSGAAAGGEG